VKASELSTRIHPWRISVPAAVSLAGALQVIWVPTRFGPWTLFPWGGKLGQSSVGLDQYPSNQSDHARKQNEHRSESHGVQKDRHALPGARLTISVRVLLLAADLDAVQFSHGCVSHTELTNSIKDQFFGATGTFLRRRNGLEPATHKALGVGV
jgi:hypothetical protein